MDNVSKEETQKQKKSILKVIYNVYHCIAEVFLYALLLILILIGILFLVYVIDIKSNQKKGINLPPIFSTYIIISPSMVPTINVLDAIVVQRIEEEQLEIGDIITFVSSDNRYSGLTITHRIIGIEKTKDGKVFYRTKGDNNNTEDAALVEYNDINGKVILKIPKIGYIQQLLTQSYGWVIVVVVPCLIIVIYDIIKVLKLLLGKSIKTKKRKNKLKDKEAFIEELMLSSNNNENNTDNFSFDNNSIEIDNKEELNIEGANINKEVNIEDSKSSKDDIELL